MAVIGANIDHLRATIAAFQQGHNTINDALQQATYSMYSMQQSQWAGYHRQQIEAIWYDIESRLTTLLSELDALTGRTIRFTDALEEAGAVFGDGTATGDSSFYPGDGMHGHAFVPTPPPGGVGPGSPDGQTEKTPEEERWEWAKRIVEGTGLTHDFLNFLDYLRKLPFFDFAYFVNNLYHLANNPFLSGSQPNVAAVASAVASFLPQSSSKYPNPMVLSAVASLNNQSGKNNLFGGFLELLKSNSAGRILSIAGFASDALDNIVDDARGDEKDKYKPVDAVTISSGLASAGFKWVLSKNPYTGTIMAVNDTLQFGGDMYNQISTGIAQWVAGPEFDDQISKNAKRMEDALKKADLMTPINKSVDELFRTVADSGSLFLQGKNEEALKVMGEGLQQSGNTLVTSFMQIPEGYIEFFDAAGDQANIIVSQTSQQLAPVIEQTGQALNDIGQGVSEGLKQMWENGSRMMEGTQQMFGGLFRW